MSLLGKKFPGLVARPMAPFYISGLVILYGVNAAAGAMSQADEYKNDPRNPLNKNPKADGH